MTTTETRDLRELILATAKSLFSQQGYHGLAMRQISESLGVAKSALYYHFKDKEQLFLAILKLTWMKWKALSTTSRLSRSLAASASTCWWNTS